MVLLTKKLLETNWIRQLPDVSLDGNAFYVAALPPSMVFFLFSGFSFDPEKELSAAVQATGLSPPLTGDKI